MTSRSLPRAIDRRILATAESPLTLPHGRRGPTITHGRTPRPASTVTTRPPRATRVHTGPPRLISVRSRTPSTPDRNRSKRVTPGHTRLCASGLTRAVCASGITRACRASCFARAAIRSQGNPSRRPTPAPPRPIRASSKATETGSSCHWAELPVLFYSRHPARNVGLMNASASGQPGTLIDFASHSISRPSRRARFPSSSDSVSTLAYPKFESGVVSPLQAAIHSR